VIPVSDSVNSIRNRLAKRLCDLVLKHIATERYRGLIEGAVRYGLNAAARDELEGRESPPPWETAGRRTR
jgi:hypothetical protein